MKLAVKINPNKHSYHPVDCQIEHNDMQSLQLIEAKKTACHKVERSKFTGICQCVLCNLKTVSHRRRNCTSSTTTADDWYFL